MLEQEHLPAVSPRVPRISTDRLLAISAVLLSMAALVVSVFQTKILRDQQRAAVWPHLQLETSMLDGNFAMLLSNNGVGPALIREVKIRYRNKPYETMVEVFNGNVRASRQLDTAIFGFYYASVVPGDVLASDKEINLFNVVNSERAAEIVAQEFGDSLLHISIRYADVYGQEWVLADGKLIEN